MRPARPTTFMQRALLAAAVHRAGRAGRRHLPRAAPAGPDGRRHRPRRRHRRRARPAHRHLADARPRSSSRSSAPSLIELIREQRPAPAATSPWRCCSTAASPAACCSPGSPGRAPRRLQQLPVRLDHHDLRRPTCWVDDRAGRGRRARRGRPAPRSCSRSPRTRSSPRSPGSTCASTTC